MNKLVVVVVLSATAWKWSSSTSSEAPGAQVTDGKLALDRLWIDHLPKNDRDPIKVFLALTEEPVGIFQTASMWQGSYELFQYEAMGNEIRAVFPQTRERETITTRASRCSDGGMDYCLELSGASRGTKKYYSMKGWELDGASRDAALARAHVLVDPVAR
ncbi:MAG: hypothetical protein NT062_07460 [Proteobacteria bacterium]|nr:hypothetical protein [Pseudomonadota bacterium]